jgi:hypothetical protein
MGSKTQWAAMTARDPSPRTEGSRIPRSLTVGVVSHTAVCVATGVSCGSLDRVTGIPNVQPQTAWYGSRASRLWHGKSVARTLGSQTRSGITTGMRRPSVGSPIQSRIRSSAWALSVRHLFTPHFPTSPPQQYCESGLPMPPLNLFR